MSLTLLPLQKCCLRALHLNGRAASANLARLARTSEGSK